MINKILIRVNHKKINKISYTGPLDDKLESLFWNIWVQFGITPNTQISRYAKIKDFGWTESARKEFYRNPNHSYLLKRLQKQNIEKKWIRTAEPALIKIRSY